MAGSDDDFSPDIESHLESTPNSDPDLGDSDAMLDDADFVSNRQRRRNRRLDRASPPRRARAARYNELRGDDGQVYDIYSLLEYFKEIQVNEDCVNRELCASVMTGTRADSQLLLHLNMRSHEYDMERLTDEGLHATVTRDTDSVVGMGKTLPYTTPLAFYHALKPKWRLLDNIHFSVKVKIERKVSTKPYFHPVLFNTSVPHTLSDIVCNFT